MSDRGQTTLDFATGASVFLLSIVFVFAFVPGMFHPFGGEQGGTLVADRAAGTLSTDLLGDPGTPYVLDRTCTVEFFDADGSTGACRFVNDSSDLSGALALGPTRRANVTLERDGAVAYGAGDEVPPGSDVETAQRVVLLDDESYRLIVRVW